MVIAPCIASILNAFFKWAHFLNSWNFKNSNVNVCKVWGSHTICGLIRVNLVKLHLRLIPGLLQLDELLPPEPVKKEPEKKTDDWIYGDDDFSEPMLPPGDDDMREGTGNNGGGTQSVYSSSMVGSSFV